MTMRSGRVLGGRGSLARSNVGNALTFLGPRRVWGGAMTGQRSLSIEKASEIALDHCSKKVTEIKKRQWDVVHSTLLIFGFLFTVAEKQWLSKGGIRIVALLTVVYFGFIFWQTITNMKRFKRIHKEVFEQTMPEEIRQRFDREPEGPFEDEGRITWGLAAVVVAACILLISKIVLVS